jgi:hypothetical protein
LNNIEKTVDDDTIQAYVNYLVQNNSIQRLDVSKMMKETLLIKFEKHVDFNGLLRRHRIAPQFCFKNVRVYQNMETSMVLIKLNFDKKKEQELHDYLVNTFQINNEICWQSFDHFSKIPFILVKFVNLEMKRRFLSKIAQNLESDFIGCVEDVPNIHLLNDFIKSFESKADNPIVHDNSINQVIQNTLINSTSEFVNLNYNILSSIQSESLRNLREEIHDNDIDVKIEKFYNFD